MLARHLVVGLTAVGFGCASPDAEDVDGVAGAQTAQAGIDTTGHDTPETAIVVQELDDSISVTERRDIAFSLPPGKTAFFRVHYRDTWNMNGVLNPPNVGLRIDDEDTDPFLHVSVDFTCDGKQNGGRAECIFGLANGSSGCDWVRNPYGHGHWNRTPLLLMSKMSCNTVTNSSGWFTIRVERDPGPAESRGSAKLRLRNALDSLNDPAVDQDAPRRTAPD